jgi:hypothetical protein
VEQVFGGVSLNSRRLLSIGNSLELLRPESTPDEPEIRPRGQRFPAQREFETGDPGNVVRRRRDHHCGRDLVCNQAVMNLQGWVATESP